MDEFDAARKTEEEMKETVRLMVEEEERFQDDAQHVRENMRVVRDEARPKD